MSNFLIICVLIVFTILIYKKNDYFSSFLNIFDKPDNKLKKHNKSISLIGGTYCYLFFSIVFSVNLIFNNVEVTSEITIIFTSSLIYFLGLYDDKKNISPNIKFILSALILFIGLNLDKSLIVNEIYFYSLNKKIYLSYLSVPFTILCILLLINALNMSDGINSLATGIVVIWIFGGLIHNFFNDYFMFLIFLIFLIFIFVMIYKTKFFLGDSGTMFLSTFIGFIIINSHNLTISNNQIPADLIFIVLMFSGYDMLRLFIIRLKNKKNPFKGDLSHLHHYLMRKFNLKKSLIIYLTLCIIPIPGSYFFKNYFLIIFMSLVSYVILITYLYFKTSLSKNK